MMWPWQEVVLRFIAEQVAAHAKALYWQQRFTPEKQVKPVASVMQWQQSIATQPVAAHAQAL